MAKKRNPNLLLVQYAFPPLRGAESLVSAKTIRFLAEQGIHITLITCKPSLSVDGTDDSLMTYVTHPNIDVHQVPTPEPRLALGAIDRLAPGALQLPDTKLLWRWRAARYAIQLLRNHSFDLLYTRSHYLSNHVVGLKLHEHAPQLPWIAHFSDPWATNPYYQYQWEWIRQRNLYWEQCVIARTQYVTFASPYTLREFAVRYPHASGHFAKLSHALDPKLYPPAQQAATKADITLGYFGAFYGNRLPTPLLTAVAQLRRQSPALFKNVRLRFVGSMPAALRHTISTGSLRDIVDVQQPVAYRDSLALMQEVNALLVIDAPTEVSPFFPSKLIDYLGAQRPILAVTPSQGLTAEFVRQTTGLVADPRKATEIARMLAQALTGLRRGTLRPAPAALSAPYLPEKVHENLLRTIHQLARS